jgi:sugar phosphate isomerase/epimerase
VKIGVCSDIKSAQTLKELGYDYIEYNMTSLAGMSESDFDAFKEKVRKSALPIEALNCFCPSEIRLSEGVCDALLSDYAKKALSRASSVGAKIAVVGSSRSRSYSEEYGVENAKEDFCRSLTILSDIAKDHSMKIAIEPLCKRETNLVNTLADAYEIAARVNRDNVGYIVDLFHFDRNGEDLHDIEKYGEGIFHTHLARRNADRRIPAIGDEGDVVDFCAALNKIGYTGRMSLEGSFHPNFDESAKNAMILFKNIGIK